MIRFRMDSKIHKFFSVQDKAIMKQAMPSYVIQGPFDPRIVAIRTRKAKEREAKEVKEDKPVLTKIKKMF